MKLNRLRPVLNSLSDGVDMQLLVDINSDYSSLLTKHGELRRNHPLVSWIGESRISMLQGDVDQQKLQNLNLYLFALSWA